MPAWLLPFILPFFPPESQPQLSLNYPIDSTLLI